MTIETTINLEKLSELKCSKCGEPAVYIHWNWDLTEVACEKHAVEMEEKIRNETL